MATKDLPEQINFHNGSYYQLSIARLPMTTFMVQDATLPTVTLPAVHTGSPFVKLNYGGDGIDFSEFRVTFKVDEDFLNYIELFNWIKGLGFPETHESYRELVADVNNLGGVRSDASLVVSSSSKVVHKAIRFRDMHPTSSSKTSSRKTVQI